MKNPGIVIPIKPAKENYLDITASNPLKNIALNMTLGNGVVSEIRTGF